MEQRYFIDILTLKHPREHTQRIPAHGAGDSQPPAAYSLNEIDARWRLGAVRNALPACVSALALRKGLALGANLPMIGVSWALCHDGAGRVMQNWRDRVLAAIDAQWAKCTGRNTSVMGRLAGRRDGSGALKPERVGERLNSFPASGPTVGTGWSRETRSGEGVRLTLRGRGGVAPGGGRYVAHRSQKLAAGETVAVEHAEPVYLRNEVAWKTFRQR